MALPLVVDLDGTLVRSDTMVESLFALLANPRLLVNLPGLLRGPPAARKQRIAGLAPPHAATLPYNEALLAWLRTQKAAGRYLVLATASDMSVARSVADHLGLFDEVFASDGTRNLKGARKAAALIERFGERGFVYAGDSRADVPVWRGAAAAVFVNVPPAAAVAVGQSVPTEWALDEGPRWIHGLWRAVRPHQWVKNLLVFVPILTAQAYGDLAVWVETAWVFLAFCAIASSLYILNDLVDLTADRMHPRKRERAFASGAVSAPTGIAAGAGLFALGIALSIHAHSVAAVAGYAATTVFYTLFLKEQPLADVFCLAALYVLRVIGGGLASGHFVSAWLIGFSGFMFLSLALVKRVEELYRLRNAGLRHARRRGYQADDLPMLRSFGCASSFASCVVLALYVQVEATTGRFVAPGLLWGLVPLFLFWQCRLWLSTSRGYMHDDPIIYAARDWVSWTVAAAAVLILAMAKSASFLAF